MSAPAPGEMWVIARSTVGPDRIDVTFHRPNETDGARHLAGMGGCRITESCGPREALGVAMAEAKKTANRDNQ